MVMPSAQALVLARIASAVEGLDLVGLRTEVQLSAASFGKAGVEELSLQVSSMFNLTEAPRQVFPTGLAFDIIPAFTKEGWSDSERRCSAELAELIRLPQSHFSVSLSVVPCFTGLAISGQLLFSAAVDPEQAAEHLSHSRWIECTELVPGPRRLVGRDKIFVGRLRQDPLDQGLHFWASADNLIAGTLSNLVGLLQLCWEEGRL